MIIVYGGAFDPPHSGHVESVGVVARRFPNAKILVMPGLKPAGAAGIHKDPGASFAHRLAMCKLAFAELKSSQVVVSDLEAQLTPPNYTVKTLEKIKDLNPSEPLALMIGQDQIAKFHQWYQPLEILRRAALMVIRRQSREGAYSENLKQDIIDCAKRLELSLDWQTATKATVKNIGSSIEFVDVPLPEAESTFIRQQITANDLFPHLWLTPAVRAYIHTHQLYRPR